MKTQSFLLPVCFFLVVLLATTAHATEYTSRVVGVHDGDTLTLLTPDRQQIKVRLDQIDAPESNQPYGTRAKQALSDLAYGKEARVAVQGTDKYGRTLGRVYVGSTDVNAELVKQGAAWVYRQYATDASLYRLESEAKVAKRGLWGLPEAERCPPWDWRKGSCPTPAAVPVSPAVSAPAVTGSAEFTCGTKRYCRQMTSCEEAKFYLMQCGVKTLDGDGDGVPCETLCR